MNTKRKRFRSLISEYKKKKDIDSLKVVLDQYYQLAVLVVLCYGDHHCNSGVSGGQYFDAPKVVKIMCSKIDCSYITHGFIENCNYISKNDWKTFVKIFGETEKSFNPLNTLN